MLGELALGDLDLAAPADAAPAADRIEVDAELARRVEHARRRPRIAALARGREDDAMDRSRRQARARRRRLRAGSRAPAFALRRRLAVLADPARAIGVVAHHHVGAEDRPACPPACSGFMIAEVMPAPIIIGRKPALRPRRFGRPKEKLEAPQVVLTFSSSRRRRIRRITCAAGVVDRADRHDQRIDDDVLARMPKSAARSTIFLATAKRTSGSSEMPVSSLEMAIDGGVVFLHQRQHALQPLLLAGDGIDQRLALVDREPRLQRRDDGGVDRQRHVDGVLHQLDASARMRGSSASGMPALTSSICAPASTCASASATTRLNSRPPPSRRRAACGPSG